MAWLAAILTTAAVLAAPSAATASTTQIAMFQSGNELMSNPAGTLSTIRSLGASTVRVIVLWYSVTKDPAASKPPAGFDASNPAAYPAANWAPYDAIIKDAQQDGMTVDLTVAGGAPVWADGSDIPKGGTNPHYAWKPSATDYGEFVHAVAERYDGHYDGLPAVHFWSIWNEPNFGEDLGPQAIDGSKVSVAPMMYRGLVNAGWNALQATGHGHDTILIGEYAARGISGPPSKHAPQGYPGNYDQTKPLIFIRTLYCVNASYKELRGTAASRTGCPTSSAASRKFRARNPGLFNATGVGDHPYPDNLSPVEDGKSDPNFAALPDLGNLANVLDHVQRVYGSSKKYPIYNDEYGYITSPPASKNYVSPSTAAYYLNWAEYLTWRNPRVKSYMQYLLEDPGPNAGPYVGFSSGLLTYTGAEKPTYSAYRLPLYTPKSSTGNGGSLEVWGDVRPAHFAQLDSHQTQTAQIQLQAGSSGAFKTVQTVKVTSAEGYFEVPVKFASSGTVRLAWTYPTTDPFFPISDLGTIVYSRDVKVTVG